MALFLSLFLYFNPWLLCLDFSLEMLVKVVFSGCIFIPRLSGPS